MSDKKIGDFFVQEPGIGGKPTDWNEVMVTPPGHPMLRNDLNKHAGEDVEIFRRTMQTLQESMSVPVGGYPKGQMAVVIGVDTPRIPVSEMDRLLLIEPDRNTVTDKVVMQRLKGREPITLNSVIESKPGWYRKRAPIITEEMMSTLENTNGRHAMLMNARTIGKSQITKAWLDYVKQCQDSDESVKMYIRAALRAKTKKGPKRKTYPL